MSNAAYLNVNEDFGTLTIPEPIDIGGIAHEVIAHVPVGISGFSGIAVREISTGKITVAFSGTDGPVDLIQDAAVGLVGLSTHGWQARDFVRSVLNDNEGLKIHLIGHSLAGQIDQFVGLDRSLAPHISSMVTLNSVGMGGLGAEVIENLSNVISGDTLAGPNTTIPTIHYVINQDNQGLLAQAIHGVGIRTRGTVVVLPAFEQGDWYDYINPATGHFTGDIVLALQAANNAGASVSLEF